MTPNKPLARQIDEAIELDLEWMEEVERGNDAEVEEDLTRE